MSHQYVNQLIHVMWSTLDQRPYISKQFQDELYAYMTSLIKSKHGNVLAIGGSLDHLHLLMTLPSEISIAEMIKHAKSYSSKWAKNKTSVNPDFGWQKGFVAISTDESKTNNVCNYIRADHLKHPFKSYQEELTEILKQQNISYIDQCRSPILCHAGISRY